MVATPQIKGGSLLSRKTLIFHKKIGNVVIDPYKSANLKTVSYDVTLGPWYFSSRPTNPSLIYNPWNEKSVRDYWGKPLKAEKAKDVFDGNMPKSLKPNDLVIVLRPGELILAHTQEFIGGRNIVTTMMKARSSMGRSGITVCKCAGWGDVGYINRWTMEIQNELPVPNLLIVGERIAQIAFFEVGPLENGDYALENGKYQTESDIRKLKKIWKPEDMLPKLWKDRL